jgi:hypothetical protein
MSIRIGYHYRALDFVDDTGINGLGLAHTKNTTNIINQKSPK